MRNSLVCLALMVLPAPTDAGAWARDKGETFLSTSVSVAAPIGDIATGLDSYGSVFLEYGLGRGLTLGLDAGMDQSGTYTAFGFLRRTLGAPGAVHKFAFQAGLGASTGSGATDILLQGGASWGRGFDTGLGPGWIGLDTSLLYQLERGDYALKADLTLGLKPSERMMWMLQLQAGDYPGSDPYLRLAPSLVRRVGARTFIEVGTQIGISGDDRVGLKLGTWLEF